VEAVFDAATVAVDYVREQRTPYFLELKTYRFRGHSMSDGGAYRTKDEIEEWRKKDPLEVLLDRMVEAGEVTREEYAAMDEAILAEIEDEIVPFAEESPEPDPKDLTRFVFVEGDPWVHGGPGKEAQ
jgi:pyruvate dehydrogenase E1 component alpha subunit